jgi:hypothetical protein
MLWLSRSGEERAIMIITGLFGGLGNQIFQYTVQQLELLAALAGKLA